MSKDSNLASTLAHETRKNNIFRKISVGLVSALLAVGIVVISSCNGDKDNKDDPAAEGRAMAQAHCNCLKAFEVAVKDLDEADEEAYENAESILRKCFDDFISEYDSTFEKYEMESENHPFWVAVIDERQKCNLEFLNINDFRY